MLLILFLATLPGLNDLHFQMLFLEGQKLVQDNRSKEFHLNNRSANDLTIFLGPYLTRSRSRSRTDLVLNGGTPYEVLHHFVLQDPRWRDDPGPWNRGAHRIS